MVMRVFTAFIAITAGILVLLGYFLPVAAPLQFHLLNWAAILAGAATIVGIFNLLTVHLDKIRRREKSSVYSALLVMGLVAALIFGMIMRPEDALMRVMVDGIIMPAEAALMGLLTISLLYAAVRLLRRRADVMGIAFLATTVILILGSATLPFGSIPGVDVFARWITQVWALGGLRGIIIGVALGSLVTGLRVLSGVDRPYGGN